MRRLIGLAILCAAAPLGARAQAPEANPVASSAREIYTRQAGYLTASAEEMPADKYGYHPTPEQLTFGRVIAHIAQSNYGLCAIHFRHTPAPQGLKISETDPKDTLVAAIKDSFAFCEKAMAALQDSKMGDTVNFFSWRTRAKVPRARVVFELTDDLTDHYSQLAGYLRLSGLLPPSAQPKK